MRHVRLPPPAPARCHDLRRGGAARPGVGGAYIRGRLAAGGGPGDAGGAAVRDRGVGGVAGSPPPNRTLLGKLDADLSA